MINDLGLIKTSIEIFQKKYSQLSDECTSEFKEHVQVVRYDKGETIVKSGQYSNLLFFIIKGSARAYYLKSGKEITDWFAFEHNLICAINSFFLNIPSPHYIAAIEPITACVISAESMDMLNKKYHEFERLSRLVTTEVMLQLQQRVVALQFESAAQKYENLLSKYPDIANRAALGHIASFLGITLETLSRIRNDRRSNLT